MSSNPSKLEINKERSGVWDKGREREFSTLSKFVAVYCNNHHETARGQLCLECRELLDYGHKRLELCAFDPKPKCRDCPAHCYRKDYRQRVREVMKFSGMYFVKRGRVDWLLKYFTR